MKTPHRAAPSPRPWIGASAALLAALGLGRWWIERAALQAHRITLDDVAWLTTLRPALASRCSGCHADPRRAFVSRADPTAAEAVDELLRARGQVTPGDPEASALRRRARGERHPRSVAPGDCVDLAITAWIEGRAVRACATSATPVTPPGLTPLGRARDAGALDLSTPARALATQLDLLQRMDYDALRGTFTAGVQLRLTDRALDACRLALTGRATDGGTAIDQDGGAATARGFGPGGLTAAFERQGDRWYANDLWCAPR